MTARPLHADVLVLGAGSAGCCAAIAAARGGARTVLVDRLGFPGGTSTAVLDTFYAFFTAGSSEFKLVAGLPDEPVRRLVDRGKAFERPNSFGSGLGYTYDPETLKLVWAGLLEEAGVEALLHTVVCGAHVDRNRIESVTLGSKAGLVDVRGSVVIDATGDADVIARAGGPFVDDHERRQAATLTFRITNVDTTRLRHRGRPRLRELIARAREDGFDLPGDGGSLHASGVEGIVHVALVRLEAPDPDDFRAPGVLEMSGIGQVDRWLEFLRRYVPGCEAANLASIAPMTGVRETRRVRGRYVLAERDVVSGRLFEDQVALCGAPIEDLSAPRTDWEHVGGRGFYGIPWRCLVPVGYENALIAGRCLSADHRAHASARSMATCMALGQAAGTAAALAHRRNAAAASVPPDELRTALATDGAIVDAGSAQPQDRTAKITE